MRNRCVKFAFNNGSFGAYFPVYCVPIKRAVLLLQLPVTFIYKINHMVTLKVTHKRAFSLVTNLGNQNLLLTNLLTIPQ